MRQIWFSFLSILAILIPAFAQPTVNFVPDASFEAPTPSWFSERSGHDHYLEKMEVTDAPDGKQVLELRAWSEKNVRILSPVFEVPAGVLSATLAVRAVKPRAEAKLELALFDEAGKKKLASFGSVTLTEAAQWKVLSGQATTPVGKVRLALLPSGPSNDTQILLDKLGLFVGDTLGDARNNLEWQLVEAEEMATPDNKSWVVRPYNKGYYTGPLSGDKMLTGSNGAKGVDNQPATRELEVKHAGTHTLWLRALYSHPKYKGGFTVSLLQKGEVVGTRDIESSDASISPLADRLNFVWVPLRAELAPGLVTVQLTRPDAASTFLARNIDLFLLTNLPNYTPKMADWQPQIYVRWTNTGSGEPYCLWTFVRLNAVPWYSRPGMLCATGFRHGVTVPQDKNQWIGPGQSTPWSSISPFLLPVGEFNRIQFTATRQMHVAGFVPEPIKGKLEIAMGADKKIVRTINFDQNAPRIRVAISGDTTNLPLFVGTGYDALKLEQEAVAPTKLPQKAAQHIDLVANLSLERGVDDPALIDAELKNLAKMGFNGTYHALTDASKPRDAVEFYRQYGMQSHLGLNAGTWYMFKDGDQTQPDLEKINAKYQKMAEENAAILPSVVRLKLADEPGGPSYEAMAKSASAQQKFRVYLQSQKVTLEELSADNWDEVLPVTEKEKVTKPALFYYSGMFRLQVAGDLAKTVVTAKKKYFPAEAKTYINYSPPFSWISRAADPFFMQRNGGFEMGWSEDWLSQTAGPQYSSDTYTLLRAAGQGQPMGGYVIGVSGGPLLQRLKYYTMVAGGARQISVYSYGPAYAGIDSWSERYELYPVLRDVQFELGKIDAALHGTTRRATKIAILYNRTAALWGGNDYTAELDARFTRWALSHAGYDADIIPEEDIVVGKLNDYQVLYMAGIQLRRDAATQIASWVQKGGILQGSAGAATRDEFNRPLSTLEEVFGAQSVDLKTVTPVGRPRFELRTQKVLDTVQAVDDAAVIFDQLCYSEALQPKAGIKVLFKDAKGRVLGTQNNVGKGVAIRLAVLPGIAYLNKATRDEGYDPQSYLPQDYDEAQRDFLTLPARLAKAEAVAQSNLRSGEISRYDAPGRSVLFVVNYAGQEKKDFSMLVPNVVWATKAYAANGAKVILEEAANDMTRVTFPLNVAGAIVLEK